MYSRKARHQLQYLSDDADDNSCEEEKEPETPMQPAKREKLVVKIPIPIFRRPWCPLGAQTG